MPQRADALRVAPIFGPGYVPSFAVALRLAGRWEPHPISLCLAPCDLRIDSNVAYVGFSTVSQTPADPSSAKNRRGSVLKALARSSHY